MRSKEKNSPKRTSSKHSKILISWNRKKKAPVHEAKVIITGDITPAKKSTEDAPMYFASIVPMKILHIVEVEARKFF